MFDNSRYSLPRNSQSAYKVGRSLCKSLHLRFGAGVRKFLRPTEHLINLPYIKYMF